VRAVCSCCLQSLQCLPHSVEPSDRPFARPYLLLGIQVTFLTHKTQPIASQKAGARGDPSRDRSTPPIRAHIETCRPFIALQSVCRVSRGSSSKAEDGEQLKAQGGARRGLARH
jgi:hypothetical protein